MSDNVITINPEADALKNKGFVQLPVCYEDLRGFITSLLGKPQSVAGFRFGVFELTKANVEYLYDLLDQRIHEQNQAELIQFSAKTLYSDDTSATQNDWISFKSYNEVKPVISTAVTLTWVYLIKFQDKPSPERQEIEVTLVTPPILDPELRTKGGLVEYQIRCTARTWASDIESKIRSWVDHLLVPDRPIEKKLLDNSNRIGLMITILILVSAVVACLIVSSNFSTEMLKTVSDHLTGTAVSLEQKVDYLAQHMAKGEWVKFALKSGIFLGTMLIISIFAGIVTTGCLERIQRPSFILFTDAAEKDKVKVLGKNRRNWITFICTTIFSVVTGVIANYIFQYLTQVK